MCIAIFGGLSAGFGEGYGLGGAGPRRRSPGLRRRVPEHQERMGNGSSPTWPDKRTRIPPVGEHPRLTRKGERKSAGADQDQEKKSEPTCHPPSGGSGCTPVVLPGWMENMLFTLWRHRRSAAQRISFAGRNHHKLHLRRGHKISFELVSSLHRRLKVAEA